MVRSGEIVKFDAVKNFTYVKPLGEGGTGQTHLFRDETTDILFAIKKYVPKDNHNIDEYYRRFVDEIKILFNLSHSNIVRVYNYYLYPDMKTGYLQMEYVEGYSIDKFKNYAPFSWTGWDDIFSETISAFDYLEQSRILHRDIRPSNILIDKNGTVKIIDFGFGKQLTGSNKADNSIFLNWPATEMPNEVQLNQEYNHKTEIYFVGTLFKHLIDDEDEFKFFHIIEKMVKVNASQRYESFSEVSRAISEGVLGEIDFSFTDKETYRQFADALSEHINYYTDKYTPKNDINTTLSAIASLIRNSALEKFIQDNSQLISCFISNSYNYNTQKDIEVEIVTAFYELLSGLSYAKQKILYDNLCNRLSTIRVEIEDELPF
jgi:serine/threonine-protein kinase